MAKRAKPVSEGRRIALLARTTPEMRSLLDQAAAVSGRSLAQEVEHRLDRSFDDDLLRGPGTRMLFAMRKVVTKVLRLSRDHDEVSEGSPKEDEIKVRKELRSAVDYISRVYAGTGEPLPEDFALDRMRPGEWGSGDIGRFHAQVFLSDWADDPTPLDRARAREVDFYWTPGPPQRSLESIMTEKDDGRARNAAAPPRPSDSGPAEGDELPPVVPAAKPKRARKTLPKA